MFCDNCRTKPLVLVSAKVTSFSGSGESGFVDDVGLKAKMSNPQQLELDSMKRRLFLSDTVSSVWKAWKHLICKLDCGKVCTRAIVAHTAGAYPGFRSMKRLGVLLLLLDGMLVHHILPPAFRQVSLTVRRYPFILVGGERHRAQEHNIMPRPGLEPRVQRANH